MKQQNPVNISKLREVIGLKKNERTKSSRLLISLTTLKIQAHLETQQPLIDKIEGTTYFVKAAKSKKSETILKWSKFAEIYDKKHLLSKSSQKDWNNLNKGCLDVVR